MIWNLKHSGSITRNARVACETKLCVTSKKVRLPDRQTHRRIDRLRTKWSLCAAMQVTQKVGSLESELKWCIHLSSSIFFIFGIVLLRCVYIDCGFSFKTWNNLPLRSQTSPGVAWLGLTGLTPWWSTSCNTRHTEIYIFHFVIFTC